MKDTGGPAFPQHGFDPVAERFTSQGGMTLRDYFAAKALAGLLACGIQPQSGPDMYARDAYAVADAMIQERSRT